MRKRKKDNKQKEKSTASYIDEDRIINQTKEESDHIVPWITATGSCPRMYVYIASLSDGSPKTTDFLKTRSLLALIYLQKCTNM